MRLLMLLLVLAGYTATGAARETDDAALAINPLDFVPLEVGNRWTYEHRYLNHDHWRGEPFDIPGYPLGDPPDSLKFAKKIVTIEITHTEAIDGLEYFVFSDADYAWPPLPDFFWGGKKVRLSDEGFLVFRWNGQELPMYDFGHPSDYEYTSTLPIGSGTTEAHLTRSYAQYRRSRVHFGLSRYSLYDGAEIIFLQEYGVGQTYIEYYLWGRACSLISFLNELMPISATISGKEIVYEQVYLSYQSLASTGLGQVGQVQLEEGFDFSEGKHSEASNDFELVRRSWNFFDSGTSSGKSACLPSFFLTGGSYAVLSSATGIADLGKMDFGLLIAQGVPPDLQLDFGTEVGSSSPWGVNEGHTFAVRSREGGVALLYLFDEEFPEKDYRIEFRADASAENIKFDWVYYPEGLPVAGTSVQPTSWGHLKQLFLQNSPNRPEE